jgi:hypothetical protein
MSLTVLHISLTPVAGSPVRIVNALNEHTDVKAYLWVLSPEIYGNRVFEDGLKWSVDSEQIQELYLNADIIHLHQVTDIYRISDQVPGLPRKPKGQVVAQLHSQPDHYGKTPADFLETSVPLLVIGQYHERYYPSARIVPNFVPIHNPLYMPKNTPHGTGVSLSFSPSNLISAWDHRWATKGAPEILAMLRSLEYQLSDFSTCLIVDKPHAECLRLKQACDIAIDDLVTGSYHLSSLESLSQGKPTFAFLDHRIERVTRELSGSDELPWLNFRLEDAEIPLKVLIHDSKLRNEVGLNSRLWMEKYWSDKKMVMHFIRAYKDLLENPGLLRKSRFDITKPLVKWFVRDSHDLVYASRKLKRKLALFKRPRIWFQKARRKLLE